MELDEIIDKLQTAKIANEHQDLNISKIIKDII